MPLYLAVVAVVVLSALPSGSKAMEPVPLDGTFQLGGPLEHNGEVTSGASHLYLSLQGDAARRLFESLPDEPFDDPCTGYRLRAQGNVACYETEKDRVYFCSFSVNLERGTVEAGVGGCF